MHMGLLCFADYHSASEVTLKDMSIIGQCQTTEKQNNAKHYVHNSWDVLLIQPKIQYLKCAIP